MLIIVRVLAVCAFAALAAASAHAVSSERAVLMIDQSGPGMINPGYTEILNNLRIVLDRANPPITLYVENVDFVHFHGERYEALVRQFLEEKYRDKRIDVLVAVGASALQFALQLGAERWRAIPVVFTSVDPDSAIKLMETRGNREVTGRILEFSLSASIDVARALVPDLKTIALVGDPLERQPFRRHFKDELPRVTEGLALIDLTGLPMSEIKSRVATLPADSAILYTAITRDGAGREFLPFEACQAIAESATRPIVVDIDNRIGKGGTGGAVVKPALLGQETARLVLQVLEGKRASSIPVTPSHAIANVFDWRQLQRWGIGEAQLPGGSQILFHEPTFWEQYRWRVVLVVAVFLLQAALIAALWFEDRRRRKAEATGLVLMSKLTHSNRVASAGQLTASIAHEIRQPLTAISASASAGLNWLKSKTPDLEEVRLLLRNIVSESHRADAIITNVRSMFRKQASPPTPIDLNDLIDQIVPLVERNLRTDRIALRTNLLKNPIPVVIADPVQLQQVVLNLIMNAAEAMSSSANSVRELSLETTVEQKFVRLAVEDTGPGISQSDAEAIFQPFFTTKSSGMGMGLTISKSIVEVHGGRLTVRNGQGSGCRFEVSLPFAGAMQ
jgi:signal transduction histidine kinase